MSRVATLQVEEDSRFYIVAVYDSKGETIEEYRAGNSSLDSQGSVEPDHPSALGFDTMLEYGKSTQAAIAEEFGAVPNQTYELVDAEGEILSYRDEDL